MHSLARACKLPAQLAYIRPLNNLCYRHAMSRQLSVKSFFKKPTISDDGLNKRGEKRGSDALEEGPATSVLPAVPAVPAAATGKDGGKEVRREYRVQCESEFIGCGWKGENCSVFLCFFK